MQSFQLVGLEPSHFEALFALPPYVSSRLISVRAYDSADLIIDAAVVEGSEVEASICSIFANPAVAYLHLHNAKRGCFSCKVVRA